AAGLPYTAAAPLPAGRRGRRRRPATGPRLRTLSRRGVRRARPAHARPDLARRRRPVGNRRVSPPVRTAAPRLPRNAPRRLPAPRPRGRALLRVMTRREAHHEG